MPVFKVKFVDAHGVSQEVEAEAADRDNLVLELRGKGSTIVEIQELVAPRPREATAGPKLGLDFGISKEDLALFTRQMATMLAAGLAFPRTLSILRKRCSSPSFGRVLDDVGQHVKQGGRVSEALAKHPDTFDAMYVNLIKVGEATGKLPTLVERLADLLDKTVALERKVKAALTYPAFILVFTVVLSYVIVAFLMPLFMPMFVSSGLNIPQNYPLTYLLMRVSVLVNNLGMIVGMLVVGAGLVYGARRAVRTKAGKLFRDRFVFRLPVISTVIRYAAVATFARTLSSLVESGMPLLQGLQLVGSSASNAVVAGAVERVADQITKGRRLSDAIEAESKVFPDLVIQMVQVGEESGALVSMLQRCAEYYESQMDSSVQRLVAVLEPGMMVLVGGIVCTFVMAVLLPIMGLAKFGS
jgi:type IV pilus assembly protein PilC